MLRHVAAFFFFNDTATTEIYTLSLHDALPISLRQQLPHETPPAGADGQPERHLFVAHGRDRKSTRLNSSHGYISYAVFCLKKKHTAAQPPLCPSHQATRSPGTADRAAQRPAHV